MKKSNIITHKILLLLALLLFISFLFFISKSYGANTLSPDNTEIVKDTSLFDLIYETPEYKSGYLFYIGRNDSSYYKIIFLFKTDSLKVHVDGFSGGNYRVNYNESAFRACYSASQNPTSLKKEYSSWDRYDTLYNSSSKDFYASFDIFSSNSYSDLFYQYEDTSLNLTLNVSNTEPTYRPVEISTNWISEKQYDNIIVEYSLDDINYYPCDTKSLNNTQTGLVEYAYYTIVNCNGAYYFRYKQKDEEEYHTIGTMNITNINPNLVPDSENPYYYEEDILTPLIKYEYIKTGHVKLYTQYISEDIINNIVCDYATDFENYQLLNLEKVVEEGQVKYRFYLDVTEDGAYHFRFYNKKLQKYTGTTTFNVYLDKIEEYISSPEKEQTDAIKENTKVNKNIFQTIGEIVSFLNPFSENFFVYKLIELLIEAIKSLFIPSENFFNDWIASLNEYFGDRFGIIYYPFELIIDFFTRVVDTVSSLNTSIAVMNIPDLKIFDVTLIQAFTFDFNSIVENDTLRMIYNIYLIVMDVILSLWLVHLSRKIFADIFGGNFSDDVVGDVRDYVENSNVVKEKERKSNFIGFRK